jgi:TatD DNase family protein
LILKEIEDFTMIIHGFSKKEQLAKQLLDNGLYFVWKILIAQSNWNQFYEYSKQSIFLETDTVEETIREVYTLAAKYKNITVTEIKEIKNNLAAVLKSNVEY